MLSIPSLHPLYCDSMWVVSEVTRATKSEYFPAGVALTSIKEVSLSLVRAHLTLVATSTSINAALTSVLNRVLSHIFN